MSHLTFRLMLTGLAALSLASQGCGAAPTKRPDPPAAQARKAPPPEEQEPYHVAPPPAYGHKVVLARSDSGSHL